MADTGAEVPLDSPVQGRESRPITLRDLEILDRAPARRERSDSIE
jgi:hypothetical protein